MDRITEELKKRLLAAWDFTDRYDALGIPYPDPKTMCQGQCEGTGWVPVHRSQVDESYKPGPGEVVTNKKLGEPWISLWNAAEEANPTDDNWHFVKCPDCAGTGKRKEDCMGLLRDEALETMSAYNLVGEHKRLLQEWEQRGSRKSDEFILNINRALLDEFKRCGGLAPEENDLDKMTAEWTVDKAFRAGDQEGKYLETAIKAAQDIGKLGPIILVPDYVSLTGSNMWGAGRRPSKLEVVIKAEELPGGAGTALKLAQILHKFFKIEPLLTMDLQGTNWDHLPQWDLALIPKQDYKLVRMNESSFAGRFTAQLSHADGQKILEDANGRRLTEQAKGRFILLRHYWKGSGAPAAHWNLKIDTNKGSLDSWGRMAKNPVENPAGVETNRRAWNVPPPGGGKVSEWMNISVSEIPPNTPMLGNPTNMPAFLEMIDKGEVDVMEDTPTLVVLRLAGGKMSGLWNIKREDPKINAWVLSRASAGPQQKEEIVLSESDFPIKLSLGENTYQMVRTPQNKLRLEKAEKEERH